MSTTFASLGVPEPIVAALARRGIASPFPIQVATIPDALAGKDLSGKAATGSGKTLAFGIPMVARVTRSAPKKPHGLVLAPTRELAIQVADELAALGTDLRILAVYGGAGIEPQIKRIRAGVDIVVATPGRLADLIERRVVNLGFVTFVVVDEADRMADMGFLPEVKRLLDQVPSDRQTVLFSATLDGAIDELVRRYQRNPVVHELAEEPAGDVSHRFWLSERPGRVALVAEIVERLGHTVVFSRTKHGADRIARQLGNAGVKAVAIHGNRSQSQRERALDAFHRGDVQALVATDVAARGIHVEGVRGVVHFDLPADPKDYIHRSGRTGRAGMPGTVVALFDATQRKDAAKLIRDAGIDAELGAPDVASLPEGPQQRFRPSRRGAGAPERAARPAAPASGRGGASSGRTDTRRGEPRRGERRGDEPRRNGARSTSGPSGSGRAPRPGRAEREARREDARAATAGAKNRAERRQAQFSDEERARRAAENEAREARRAERAAKPGRRAGAGTAKRPDHEHVLPADTPGGARVRPSGASRRKAKREALVAAGEPPARTRRARSGTPRPPASTKGRSGR